MFSACYPPRDANGNYWPTKCVWKRILSKKEHKPNEPFIKMPRQKSRGLTNVNSDEKYKRNKLVASH